MRLISRLILAFILTATAGPLVNIEDGPKYSSADHVDAPANPVVYIDQINNEGIGSDSYLEAALENPGANLISPSWIKGQNRNIFHPIPFQHTFPKLTIYSK